MSRPAVKYSAPRAAQQNPETAGRAPSDPKRRPGSLLVLFIALTLSGLCLATALGALFVLEK